MSSLSVAAISIEVVCYFKFESYLIEEREYRTMKLVLTPGP